MFTSIYQWEEEKLMWHDVSKGDRAPPFFANNFFLTNPLINAAYPTPPVPAWSESLPIDQSPFPQSLLSYLQHSTVHISHCSLYTQKYTRITAHIYTVNCTLDTVGSSRALPAMGILARFWQQYRYSIFLSQRRCSYWTSQITQYFAFIGRLYVKLPASQ